ncbi:MAG: EF-hand domain-containing protein [Henriciella sp.]
MRKRFEVAIIGLCVTGLMGYASAQVTEDPEPRPIWTTMDSDADGHISRDEMRANSLQRFESADMDGDGAVTLEEFQMAREAARQARLAARQERLFDQLDTDQDGQISAAEFEAQNVQRRMRMFDRLDSNDDDMISATERAAVRAGRRPVRGPRPGRPSHDR